MQKLFSIFKIGKACPNDIQCIINKCHERKNMEIASDFINKRIPILPQSNLSKLQTENLNLKNRQKKSDKETRDASFKNSPRQSSICTDLSATSLFDEEIESTSSFEKYKDNVEINYKQMIDYFSAKSVYGGYGISRKKIAKKIHKSKSFPFRRILQKISYKNYFFQ